MRKALFYPKLAASNLRTNAKTYLPYLLTCIVTVAMYYIMRSLQQNPGLRTMPGSETLTFTLSLGTVVVALFSLIFLFYTHSFLLRRRKKEFGLFNILGMEKKHISFVLLFETLYTACIALVLGIVLGVVLSRLLFLILLKILHLSVSMPFVFPIEALTDTALLFCGIFLLTFLSSLWQIHLANPITLLKGDQTGEREPRVRWVLLVVGLLSLGSGYYIALTTKDPVTAMMLFFAAVILVIIGTYCLFVTGITALLKLMRRNKSYYYQTRHFISLSGMMYRMKQNAVGLANICILSTMVLAMVSATVSMYVGMEDVLHTRYPNEININDKVNTAESAAVVDETVREMLSQSGLEVENRKAYRYLSFAAVQDVDTFTLRQASPYGTANMMNLCFIPLSDFTAAFEMEVELAPGEALVFSNRNPYREDNLTVSDHTYAVQSGDDRFMDFQVSGAFNMDIVGTYYVVVPDWADVEAMDALQTKAYGEQRSQPRRVVSFDLGGTKEQRVALGTELSSELTKRGFSGSVESRSFNEKFFFAMYGGLLYLGVFLGVLFLMATVLIMYYKQISEGYDDQRRFLIMRQVGLSRKQIRGSIRSQILLMFFLPLLVACIHIAFAFPFITRILAVFNLTNVGLFALFTLAGIAVFGLFYAAMYGLTARVYYRIVGESH